MLIFADVAVAVVVVVAVVADVVVVVAAAAVALLVDNATLPENRSCKLLIS